MWFKGFFEGQEGHITTLQKISEKTDGAKLNLWSETHKTCLGTILGTYCALFLAEITNATFESESSIVQMSLSYLTSPSPSDL